MFRNPKEPFLTRAGARVLSGSQGMVCEAMVSYSYAFQCVSADKENDGPLEEDRTTWQIPTNFKHSFHSLSLSHSQV